MSQSIHSSSACFLGIETSCDETAAAVVQFDGRVRSNIIYSQIADHKKYGGVVPELASRCHVQALPEVVRRAMQGAEVDWADVSGIAVTRGPGLATSLLTGVAYARGLSLRLGVPLYGVNHLIGHIQSICLAEKEPAADLLYPHLTLLVSGGHTCLIARQAVDRWQVLGQTLDDAAGEALDKGARVMGLGYPGGPEIEKLAKTGNPSAIAFPRGNAPAGSGGWEYPFTYSGLKTSLLYHVRNNPDEIMPERLPHLAASYQEAVVDTLMRRVKQAVELGEYRMIGCAGGVARNGRLREKLALFGEKVGLPVWFARPEYCADNAAMIAAAGMACYAPNAHSGSTTEVDPNLSLMDPLIDFPVVTA
ncbi:MAG TPA: tRNA (adenosine(37)-N6)-threonylcarbamoyltransferase complex transferase subunit TsaD [Kiritimatiellia bacterium]|nr:tRNA (adenosine(37)-N6)-threonylcarbamoyltransferase complex transferase subunit TsaD [Kiritimatiellia bacterium]